MRKEIKKALLLVLVFLICFWLPVGFRRFDGAVLEALHLIRWYAREHVLLCLIPAFFIAGAIGVFVRQDAVMRHLGAKAPKAIAYGVAAVSGTVLAVCSCTVLPLFAGIYRMGAGLGPACAFLYSGPAINVLAIVLTARVLGLELGIARAVGAVLFSVVIGLGMHAIFKHEQDDRGPVAALPVTPEGRHLWQDAALLVAMVGVLIFANWARSGDVRAAFLCCPGGLNTFEVEGRIVSQSEESITVETPTGRRQDIPSGQLQSVGAREPGAVYNRVHQARWGIVLGLLILLGVMIARWSSRDERREWVSTSWGFAGQILPLLLLGVAAAGFLLGRPGHGGMIPARYIEMLVGGSPDALLATSGLAGTLLESFLRSTWMFWTNFAASLLGAFMYFATLTEVPALQALLGAGMGKGPALALLLAGPALSLPNMLVIRSVIGTKKTVVFTVLVVTMATLTGMVYGALMG
ncbi:MAG: hypothetical protein HN742_28530 [Lentisphaerae bacterium]|jgi:uncharacterized protein|nr:hypothetical protein [Lentisphaerota bacterium]MBT4817143.1 hypothetical protein [Lentisphaerota bacterium]MBT5611631.1 hypothetical protein [Lentisphaerota bacterium]MBT7056598.1 hypothetical protein [Lentisphaerota bacterium]MBT7845854.1 hypothetical protein [Lentisphaerota bacterium]